MLPTSLSPLSLGGKYLTESQRQELVNSLQDGDLGKIHRQGIEIMLLADEGRCQTEICQILGCSSATVGRWVLLAKTGQIHQWKKQCRGRPQKLEERHLSYLKELLKQSPRDYGYDYDRWSGKRLSKQLQKEFGIKVSEQHINRLLKNLRPRLNIRDLPVENLSFFQ